MHGRRRADVGAECVRAGLAQLVGAFVDLLDPVVRLARVTREQLAHPVGVDERADLCGAPRENGGRVDEPLVAQHDRVVEQRGASAAAPRRRSRSTSMSASNQCSTSPSAASAPVWHALARPQPSVTRTTRVRSGRTSGSVEEPGAVVGDDDLEQLRGIGLGREAGEHGRQQPAGVVGRDHDRDAQRGLPGAADIGHGQGSPVVAADPRLVGHGASLSSSIRSSVSSSISACVR